MVRPPPRSVARVVSLAADLAKTVADHSSDPDGRSQPAEFGETVERTTFPVQGRRELARSVSRTRVTVVAGVKCVAFWLAIVLPFITLPFLASGISTRSELTVIISLFVVNLLALVVGKNHRRP